MNWILIAFLVSLATIGVAGAVTFNSDFAAQSYLALLDSSYTVNTITVNEVEKNCETGLTDCTLKVCYTTEYNHDLQTKTFNDCTAIMDPDISRSDLQTILVERSEDTIENNLISEPITIEYDTHPLMGIYSILAGIG